MKTYMRKVGKTLLFGLAILVIGLLIYLVMPKYQIHSVRFDDDYVVVTKINTITGDVFVFPKKVVISISPFDKYE